MKAFVTRLIQSKLLTQSGFYLAGQLFQKATSFLLVPVWTLYLLPSDYGIVGTMGAYNNLLHIALMLGIYGAIARFLYDKHSPEERRSYVFSNFVFLSASSGIVILFLVVLGDRWWNRASSGEIPFHPFVALTLVSVWAGLVSRFLLILYQAQQRAIAYITLEAFGFVLSVGFGLVFVAVYKMGAYGQILGAFIGQIVTTAIAVVVIFRSWFSVRLAWAPILDALKFGLPIVPHLLSAWALTFVDRVMLERFVPLADVGFYNLGYNLGMGMLVLVTSINQAYQPYYYDLMTSSSEPQQKVIRITSLSVAGLGVITLVGSLFAGELIALLTPFRYQQAAIFVPPILMGYLFVGLYFFVGSPVFFHKKTKVLPIITGGAAILNIILNLILIPKYGAIAAAWATVIAYGAMLVFYYVVAQRLAPTKYPLTRYMILVGILLVIIIFTSPTFELSLLKLVAKLAICVIYAIIAYVLVAKTHLPRLSIR